jgi:predicted dienelactone hydrolase
MRPLEWITIILLLAAWSSLLIPAKKLPHGLAGVPLLPLIAAGTQWILEQYRWSMVPAYVLAVLFFIIGITRIWTNKPQQPAGLGRRIINGTGAVLSLAAVAVAAALPELFPVFSLPLPTGPHTVGTTGFEWVDDAREELFTPDPADHRDLIIQVWYPAEKTDGAQPIPMWPDAGELGRQVAKTFGMPAFLFNQLALVPSHAYADAPVAVSESGFPVLIFSHAYIPGYAGQNIVQMEELASHGYVVFSIAHPYEAALVEYPDGRRAPFSEDRYQAVIRKGTVPAIPILKEVMAADDPAEKEKLFRQYLAANPAAWESVKVWSEDTFFVMDRIERLNRGEIASPFSGRLDPERLGVFGHSMGGVVAGEVCMRDGRCKAGVNLDGVQLGDLIDGSLDQPFLMMYSAVNAGQNDSVFDRFRNTYYRVVVQGTVHTDYCDFPLISPLFRVAGAAGSLNPYRMEKIINSYLLAFFGKHLTGIDSPLLNGPDPEFPEVDFRVRNAD